MRVRRLIFLAFYVAFLAVGTVAARLAAAFKSGQPLALVPWLPCRLVSLALYHACMALA